MRKYERAQLHKSAGKTIIGCIGWGLLGYLMMTSIVGMFWPGWVIMSTALCIGAYSLDRLIEVI